MFYIRIFSFTTGLAQNRFDYMRFPIRLLLTYDSLIVHLGELVRSGEVNQFN